MGVGLGVTLWGFFVGKTDVAVEEEKCRMFCGEGFERRIYFNLNLNRTYNFLKCIYI